MQIARISQMKKLIAHFSISVSLLAAIGLFIMHAMAVDVPAKPAHYFNDYASLIDPRTAQQLDQRLEDFERQTSNQILIVIYPSLPADAAIEDFTQDAFRAWRPGQQGRDNGAILFVFVKDRKMRIQTGYGLEGALPDAICKRIISDELAPRFQAGDFNGGMTAAVNAMIAATRGEYKGTGRTVAQGQKSQGSTLELIILFVVLGIVALSWLRAARRGTLYTSSGSRGSGGIWWIGGGGGGGGGGSSGGGGDSGFSGGGGDSGGGGASGGW